jgi:hypothetical protein
MSNGVRTEPVPTLEYYEGQRSGPLPRLVRLVLLAGAAGALATAISAFLTILMVWPHFRAALRNPFSSPIEDFSCGVLFLAFLSPAGASVGCLLLLRSSSTKVFTLWAEGGMIAVKASYAAIALYDYASTRPPHFPGLWKDYQITQTTADFLSSAVLPVLIILVLLGKDLHRSGEARRG